jgi:large conductance mechanosensitive channel
MDMVATIRSFGDILRRDDKANRRGPRPIISKTRLGTELARFALRKARRLAKIGATSPLALGHRWEGNMSWFSDFKAFIQRGNVIDLAVAVIMGAAFGKIVTSLVGDLVMPLIGIVTKSVSLVDMKYELPNPADPDKVLATLKYGSFLQTGIDFFIVAFCVFLLVKLVNMIHKSEPSKPAELTTQEKLLTEIRDLLKGKPDGDEISTIVSQVPPAAKP